MATETFYKRIILSNEAAEKLADGFDKPRATYVPDKEVLEAQKRGQEWLKRLSESKKS
ncbi:MAG: hypothetical protein FWH05_07740 [Oscillospiraceae bacterium]|nr:hypothetical protein [Oscillospiraceae bacterium]